MTDPEDPWALGPPSPCDVEFANANVVIDGKSSIRQKAKEMKVSGILKFYFFNFCTLLLFNRHDFNSAK